MAFSKTWDNTAPDGATTPAADIDVCIKDDKIATQERLTNLTGLANGTPFNTDPWAPTKYGPAVSITEKCVHSNIYDNGNSGSSITVSAKNGNRQKISINTSTTISLDLTLPEGSDFTLQLIWTNPGATVTFNSSQVKWSNNTPPTFTLSGRSLVYFYMGPGATWDASLSMTGNGAL